MYSPHTTVTLNPSLDCPFTILVFLWPLVLSFCWLACFIWIFKYSFVCEIMSVIWAWWWHTLLKYVLCNPQLLNILHARVTRSLCFLNHFVRLPLPGICFFIFSQSQFWSRVSFLFTLSTQNMFSFLKVMFYWRPINHRESNSSLHNK